MRSRLTFYKFTIFCFSMVLTACGMINLPQDHRSVEFTTKPSPHGENKFPNWPAPPQEVEGEISQAMTASVKSGLTKPHKAKHTAQGVSAPNVVDITFPELHEDIKFKWKVSPSAGDGLENFNNSIARELATYQIQKLFLDPEDYVVPTSLGFCVPYEVHSRYLGLEATPQIEGSDCVFGNASVWLQDIHEPDVLFEESRFLKDPNYAYFLSNFNILTYLVEHRDARSANVMTSKDEQRRQVFTVDNTTTFGTIPYNPYATNWNIIRAPALRKETIDRLRKIKREDLDFLGVVAQLDKNKENIFQNVLPGKNMDDDASVRIQPDSVQFGLTEDQIDDVWDRLEELINDVDDGKIPVF